MAPTSSRIPTAHRSTVLKSGRSLVSILHLVDSGNPLIPRLVPDPGGYAEPCSAMGIRRSAMSDSTASPIFFERMLAKIRPALSENRRRQAPGSTPCAEYPPRSGAGRPGTYLGRGRKGPPGFGGGWLGRLPRTRRGAAAHRQSRPARGGRRVAAQ